MTAWPGAKTLHVTDEALHTDFNTFVRDALDNLYNAPQVQVKRVANQSITQNTGTNVIWTDEIEDPYGFHAVNAENLVVPAGMAGLYVIGYCLEVQASATASEYHSWLTVNDDFSIAEDETPGTGDDSAMTVCTVWPLAAGDFVNVQVLHDHSAARNLLAVADYSPRLAMVWVAP